MASTSIQKLYASVLTKNPTVCDACEENDDFDYYTEQEVEDVYKRLDFFSLVKTNVDAAVTANKNLLQKVSALGNDISKKQYENDNLQLPQKAGDKSLETDLINKIRDFLKDLDQKINRFTNVAAELQSINTSVSVNASLRANKFILKLEDNNSMWKTQYDTIQQRSFNLLNGVSINEIQLRTDLNNWLTDNNERENELILLLDQYSVSAQEKDKLEVEFRKTYPITIWNKNGGLAALKLKVQERKASVKLYNDTFNKLAVLQAIPADYQSLGLTDNGAKLLDVAPNGGINLEDAIIRVTNDLNSANASNTSLQDAIDNYRAQYGNVDDTEIQNLQSNNPTTAKGDIIKLFTERKQLLLTYIKYKATADNDNSRNMTVQELKNSIAEKEKLYDEFRTLCGLPQNASVSALYSSTNARLKQEIIRRNSLLTRARLIYSANELKTKNSSYKFQTDSFEIEVNSREKLFEKARAIYIQGPFLADLDSTIIETMINKRKNILEDNNVTKLYEGRKILEGYDGMIDDLLKKHAKKDAVTDGGLKAALEKRKKLINAYQKAGNSDNNKKEAKKMTDDELENSTKTYINTYEKLKQDIERLGGGAVAINGLLIAQTDAKEDRPPVQDLKDKKAALMSERAAVIGQFDSNVMDALKISNSQYEKLTNSELKIALTDEKNKLNSQQTMTKYTSEWFKLNRELVAQTVRANDDRSQITQKQAVLQKVVRDANILKNKLGNETDPKYMPLQQKVIEIINDATDQIKKGDNQLAILQQAATQSTTDDLNDKLDVLLDDNSSRISYTRNSDALIRDAALLVKQDLVNNSGQMLNGDEEQRQIIGDILMQDFTNIESKQYNNKTALGLKGDMVKLLDIKETDLNVSLNEKTVKSYEKNGNPLPDAYVGSWARIKFKSNDQQVKKYFDSQPAFNNYKVFLEYDTIYIKLAVLKHDGESDEDYQTRKAKELRVIGNRMNFINGVNSIIENTKLGKSIMNSSNSSSTQVMRKKSSETTLINIAGVNKNNPIQFTLDEINDFGIVPSPNNDYSYLYAPSVTGFSDDLKLLKLGFKDIMDSNGNEKTGKLQALQYIVEHFSHKLPIKDTIKKIKGILDKIEQQAKDDLANNKVLDVEQKFASSLVVRFAKPPLIQTIDHMQIRTTNTGKAAVNTGDKARQYYVQCKKGPDVISCSVFGHNADLTKLAKLRGLAIYKSKDDVVLANKAVTTNANNTSSLTLMDTDDEDVESNFRFIPNI